MVDDWKMVVMMMNDDTRHWSTMVDWMMMRCDMMMRWWIDRLIINYWWWYWGIIAYDWVMFLDDMVKTTDMMRLKASQQSRSFHVASSLRLERESFADSKQSRFDDRDHGLGLRWCWTFIIWWLYVGEGYLPALQKPLWFGRKDCDSSTRWWKMIE